MNFTGFYGNKLIKEYLSGSLKKDAFPHALLLTGPKGIGKQTLSEIITKALVCTHNGERPCGVCQACKKAEKGIHPDIEHIDFGSSSIKVKEIRSLKKRAVLLPNDGERKVYVIHNAELLEPESQDALLKILEEPPLFTFFILICYNQDRLFETVRSRCSILTLSPLEYSDAAKLISERFPELDKRRLDELVKQSCGIVGGVLSENIENGEFSERAVKIADALSSGSELALFKAMMSVEKLSRAELQGVLDALTFLLRDALMIRCGLNDRLINEGGKESALSLAKALTEAKILAINELIGKSQRDLRSNAGAAHITGRLACQMYVTAR